MLDIFKEKSEFISLYCPKKIVQTIVAFALSNFQIQQNDLTHALMAGNSLIEALFHFSTVVLTANGRPTISINPNAESLEAWPDPMRMTVPNAARASVEV